MTLNPTAHAVHTRAGGTGIVMLNMGGPESLDDVEPFLLNLFADRELLRLPWQNVLGRALAKRRAPRVRGLYAAIGGGSPIRRWTEAQGRAMVERLDRLSPSTAPHRFYVAFRYVSPSADEALHQMAADGVTRAVAFSQYPQHSCTTTGSSLGDLWRALERTGTRGRFRWSVIDRWPTHHGFVQAMAERVREGLATYPDAIRDDVLLLFSAHSLPLSVIARGDAYPQEVGASVHAVLDALALPNPSLLCYQSEVGPVRWLGPSTERVIRQLARDRRHNVLVVPIAFTSDHIETLSEIDREYGELAHTLGLDGFRRAPALNDSARFADALADLVHTHLHSGARHSARYRERCPGCISAHCRRLPDAVAHPLAERAFAQRDVA
ncbi:MAG: ferrochelatase [Gemmatimonadaceae bacterium]|jgi:ferrochelatase|nr:ferrochelatase [Gemmatimonadaceae bacterium]